MSNEFISKVRKVRKVNVFDDPNHTYYAGIEAFQEQLKDAIKKYDDGKLTFRGSPEYKQIGEAMQSLENRVQQAMMGKNDNLDEIAVLYPKSVNEFEKAGQPIPEDVAAFEAKVNRIAKLSGALTAACQIMQSKEEYSKFLATQLQSKSPEACSSGDFYEPGEFVGYRRLRGAGSCPAPASVLCNLTVRAHG